MTRLTRKSAFFSVFSAFSVFFSVKYDFPLKKRQAVEKCSPMEYITGKFRIAINTRIRRYKAQNGIT